MLSGTLLLFLGWTLVILMRQKRAWKEFAKKHNLRYKVSGLMLSPEVTGVIDGYSIALFTGEHGDNQSRTTRKMSAVEIVLHNKMPVAGAVGSGNMVSLIQKMNYGQEYRPKVKGWDKEHIILSENARFMKAYLNKDRLGALLKLMKMKNAWVIFIFTTRDTLLRIDTPDALSDLEKIENTVQRLIKTAKLLELEKSESKKLMEEASAEKAARAIKLDDTSDTPLFELEDDEAPAEKS